jgi:voltage-gated potassium channel
MILSLLLFVGGTVGYILIEEWTLVESFYMTVIALTTVGFGEVRPLSPAGRVFTTFLILLGVGTVAYGLTTGVEVLLTSRLGEHLQKRRMTQQIKRLRNHVIVCGYGRVGQSAIDSLRDSNRDVVLIERNAEKAEEAINEGLIVVEGDATRDEVLRQAGVDHAWSLIVSSGDDSVNLFVVLSARALNADLFIITRSIDAENESKMRLAGADRVVSPYRIGGRHMANITIRPHVTDFFDVVTLDNGVELWVEELVIAPDSELVGKTVGEADVRRRTGVTLIALLHHNGERAITPDAETTLSAGDELIVLGTREQLARLGELTGTEAADHPLHPRLR